MPSLLLARDIGGDVKANLPSAWDKCMSKTYCKWPVIVAIIIVAGIILSLLFCIARCICCGAECACCCFKCCTSCCPSGGRRNKNGHKRMDSGPPPRQAYPATYPPQPSYPPAPAPINTQYRSPAPPVYERPQFATFETPSKPVNEDALPAMPSWSEAKSHRVEEMVIPEKPGDVEMDRLNNEAAAGTMVGGAAAAPHRSPIRSPVHRSPSHDNYSTAGQPQRDAYAMGAPQRSPQSSVSPHNERPRYGGQQEGYRGTSPQAISPVYAAGGGYGRAPPRQMPIRQNSRPTISPGPPNSSYETGVQGYAMRKPSQPAYEMPSPGFHQEQAFAAASTVRSSSPGYAPSGSTRYEPSTAAASVAYPGQQSYQPAAQEAPGYQAYRPPQASELSPGNSQNQPAYNFSRKPVNGSWKDV